MVFWYHTCHVRAMDPSENFIPSRLSHPARKRKTDQSTQVTDLNVRGLSKKFMDFVKKIKSTCTDHNLMWKTWKSQTLYNT